MIVRVNHQDKVKHACFYEGTSVSTWSELDSEGKCTGILGVTIESRNDSVTLSLDNKEPTQIFIMNDSGKTIEKIYLG